MLIALESHWHLPFLTYQKCRSGTPARNELLGWAFEVSKSHCCSCLKGRKTKILTETWRMGDLRALWGQNFTYQIILILSAKITGESLKVVEPKSVFIDVVAQLNTWEEFTACDEHKYKLLCYVLVWKGIICPTSFSWSGIYGRLTIRKKRTPLIKPNVRDKNGGLMGDPFCWEPWTDLVEFGWFW